MIQCDKVLSGSPDRFYLPGGNLVYLLLIVPFPPNSFPEFCPATMMTLETLGNFFALQLWVPLEESPAMTPLAH